MKIKLDKNKLYSAKDRLKQRELTEINDENRLEYYKYIASSIEKLKFYAD